MSCSAEKKESNKPCSGCCKNCKNKKIESSNVLLPVMVGRIEDKHDK